MGRTLLVLMLPLAAVLLVLNPGLVGGYLYVAAGLILLGAFIYAHRFRRWRRLQAMLYVDLAVVLSLVASETAAAGTGAFETLGAFGIPIFLLVLVPLTVLAGTADHHQQSTTESGTTTP